VNKRILSIGIFLSILAFAAGSAWSDSVGERRQCDRTCFSLTETYLNLSDEFQKGVEQCQAGHGEVDWVSDRDAADRFHRCDDALREWGFASSIWQTKVCRMACAQGEHDFVRETDWAAAGRQAYADLQAKWAQKPLHRHFELDLTSKRLEAAEIGVLHEAIRRVHRADSGKSKVKHKTTVVIVDNTPRH
jgi:hypothetical protein